MLRIGKNISSLEEVIANDDLLTKILLRLPVKSILRFKSVSKHWRCIITDPRFATLRNPDPSCVTGLFFNHPPHYGENNSHKLNFIPLVNDKISTNASHLESITHLPSLLRIIILESCNGLLLCSGYNEAWDIWDYHVLNPTTKQFETLPDPHRDCMEGPSLAYDPSISDHFKVVCISSTPGTSSDTFQIEIYSSETQTWKASGERFTTNAVRMYLSRGVYWNGAINWLNSASELLYFNVDEERFGFIQVPSIPLYNFWNMQYYFGESNGHLHFVDFSGPTTEFNVKEMKRDYSEWFVKYQVDLAAIATSFPEIMVPSYSVSSILHAEEYDVPSYSVSSILRAKEYDEGSFMVLYIRGKFIRYNFVDESYQIIYEYDGFTSPGEDSYLLTTYPYIESLSSF